MKKVILISAMIVTGFFCLVCSGPGDVAGGGTETETYGIIGNIVNPDGLPAIDATVRIRPLTYLPGDDLPNELDQDFTTDEQGAFAIPRVPTGWYGAIARNLAGQASYQLFHLQKAGTLNKTYTLPEDTLHATGILQGTVRFPQTFPLTDIDVALQGLDLEQLNVTNSQPDFALDSIPSGTYTMISTPAGLSLSLDALELLGIRIGADSTTVLDTIDFRFLDSLVIK